MSPGLFDSSSLNLIVEPNFQCYATTELRASSKTTKITLPAGSRTRNEPNPTLVVTAFNFRYLSGMMHKQHRGQKDALGPSALRACPADTFLDVSN
jgi:hypothetical protein